jgi:phosphoribosylanthranilate isomerase
MTWVKICATTNLDDALLAVEAGADAIGFVLGPSKRRVSPETVAAIVHKLPPQIEKIGVFLNETPDRVVEIVKQTGLTGVQLHGNETPSVAQQVANQTSAKIVKGIHAGPALMNDLTSWSAETDVTALLLDSGNGQSGGGTGKTFDWQAAADALGRLSSSARLIVAGGLNPSNVSAAIDRFHPWGVDVASGVELEPGKKDPQKVKAFVAAVRNSQR